jgi:hypothetical protein
MTASRRLALAITFLAGVTSCDPSSSPGPSPQPPPAPPPGTLEPLTTFPVPPNYGIHDTFIRDGIAFLFVWNTGVTILDVGGGGHGGSPADPVTITTFQPNNGSLPTPAIHNGWYFNNPSGTQRYLFLGQEGPATLGSTSAGDIKVIDVTNLEQPTEVAFYRVDGAGTHNFWMNEEAQLLYAAFYNAGVVVLDVSGTLSGNLASRELARVAAVEDSTYVWGVMLANNHLYASDMLTGFWQLDPTTLQPVAGGRNVPERFGSDLWVRGDYAYSGTWGVRNGTRGDAVKIWHLNASGAPTLADSITVDGITTVSDIEVSDDGRLLVFSAEGQSDAGLYIYRLTNPAKPTFVTSSGVPQGIHTVSLGRVATKLYAFAAKNPASPALLIYDLSPFDAP